MKRLVLLFAPLLISFFALTQPSECIRDFDYLVSKIEADYPGYHDKVTPITMNALKSLEQSLREKILHYPDSCGRYLEQYASWFKDSHLKVRRKWSPSGDASGIRAEANPEYLPVNDATLESLRKNKEGIEGIWVSFRDTIGILKKPEDGKLYGVNLRSIGCEPDQVRYEFIPDREDEFNMIAYPGYNNFKPIRGKASLRLHGRLLELHEDTRFVRMSEAGISDKALLYSYLPEFPNGTNTYPLALSLTDSTFLLRIPSFMNDVANILVEKHWQEIVSRPNLILDIRNNGGGQDQFFQPLAALVYTHPYESKGVEWYATPNNIKLLEDALNTGEINDGEAGIEWTESLLDEMKKHICGFVVHPMMGGDSMVKKDTVYPNPKRVGIIINENNGSSAEQFILEVRESDKVTLFGNRNTAGVLDYSNAVSEDFPSGKFTLTFPMTRSRRLPAEPIDNIGISPDVVIPYPPTAQLYDRLDQWVYFVKNYLELTKQ